MATKLGVEFTLIRVGVEEKVLKVYGVAPFGIPSGITDAAFDAKGDLLVGTGADAWDNLPVGSNDQVLTADSTQPGGMKWAAPATSGNAQLTNKSGSDRNPYDVVVKDTANDNAFKTTTTAGDLNVIGVLAEAILNNAAGAVAVAPRLITVNVQGNVTRGNFLWTSTTAGRAADAGSVFVPGCFAIAKTGYAGGGAGTVTALLLVGIGLSFLDREGDPAAVGSAADGTSKYAARRDHSHDGQGKVVAAQMRLDGRSILRRTTDGATAPSQEELTTNKQNFNDPIFPDAATKYGQWRVAMPSDYDGGTITAKFYWRSTSASTNVVRWGLRAISYAYSDALDAAFGTAQLVDDANQAANVEERTFLFACGMDL